jgi:hypothetical protein
MYNFNLMKISFIRGNRKIVKLAKKLFSESPKNNTQRENLKMEQKFTFEKEEESAQEKYKDYFIKNIKEEEALRRSVDQQFYDQLKKNSLSPTKFSSLLIKRNFLKFKEENFKQDEVKEINLKDLDDLNIEEPITLYEIDLNSVTQYKKLDSLIKNYSILFVLFNCCFAFSFKLLFMQTTLIYLTTYLINVLTFITFLYVNKLKNFKILAIEFLPNEKSLVITKWKYFSKNVQKIKFSCDELEIFESDKYFEGGLNFRLKNHKNMQLYLGSEEEGIWHNRKIFDEIFKKL